MKTIHTEHAPAAIGPYSQAIQTGNMLFASGQVPLSPETGEVVGTAITEQAEQVMKNISAILEADTENGKEQIMDRFIQSSSNKTKKELYSGEYDKL